MLTLLVLQGPDRGKRFELPDRPALVGRERANVRLDDNTCSRRHAELRPAAYGDRWTLKDLGSANGTWLNGQRVLTQPIDIKSGDQIRIGSTLLLFGAAAGVSRETTKSVALETAESGMDSSIISTLPATSDDSIVLAVPEPAAAAMANLKVLYRLAAALGSQFTDDQVLDVVLDLVFETVRADQAVAFLYDIDGKLTPRAVRRR
ncbi:MAG: FHA domain-containing protein, partial [Planctomycetota bacterium]